MSDAIRTDDMETAPVAELPVFDEILAPIRKPARAKTVRTASRETGDAFDRAFAALEEALRERDESLAKPMPMASAPAPLSFRMPEIKPTVQPVAAAQPKYVEPVMVPTVQFSAPSSAFVAPAFERLAVELKAPVEALKVETFGEANAPIIQPLSSAFERVDAILAQMQETAHHVMESLPAFEPMSAVTPQAPSQASSKAYDEVELMPFGHASLRMMVM